MASVQIFIGFFFVPSAVANPFCHIPMVCEVKDAIDFVQDPLGFLLQKLVETNIWFLREMLELIQASTKIDLTGAGFLKQYAIIFAASSLITVALWLVAVAKRAVRGVPVTTAISEAVGFLALSVTVNALTPGAIGLLMAAINDVAAVFEPYAVSNFKPFLENLLKVMAADPTDGVGTLLVVNLVMLFGALLMWVELLIASAAIYVGVALGPVVNAGLVDKDLWGKSKKWFAALLAIGMSKPILFALLGLGGAILSDSTGSRSDAVSRTLVGALILFLAVFASAMIYKWVPVFGDEMMQLNHDRKALQSTGPASAVDGPAQHANRAINTHVQDALVGGGQSAGATAGRAGPADGKAAVGKQAGTASAKGAVGSGGTAAAGPVGMAAAAVKAGADMAKDKAMSSPGAQGMEAVGGNAVGAEHGPDSTGESVPASATHHGAAAGPTVITPSGGEPEATPSPAEMPASARPHGGSAAPIVGAPGAGAESGLTSAGPIAPPPSAPAAPSYGSGRSTVPGSVPSTPPVPPARPTDDEPAPRPSTGKDK
ncbi:hypothetical protein FF041_34535 [Streptomyces jumonjinensis]|uniref:Type IV secretion system protein n=1 Tax=Streptomyces jumonjinensis TaxID=1945 RepID=A0A646KT83_STRJU|nr:hypothetical protein [Streptomyces jumonjinensis]